MLKLHYVCNFMANDLSCLRTMKSNPPLGDHADAHTFETMDIRSWRHLETLSVTTSSLYLPFQISMTWEMR